MNRPRRFTVWGNTAKKEFWDTLPGVMGWAEKQGLEVYLTTRILRELGSDNPYSYQVVYQADDFTKTDFVLALGGDGTILSAARAIAERRVPILGIHLGDLGFLAKVTLEDLYARLDQVAAGDYTLEERMTLQAQIWNGSDTKQYTALNDFVIDNGDSHRMLTLKLEADGRFVGRYKADGIIIATPTGSTAYSLAAGGPIVAPEVDSMIITPICPHTLTSRPLVLPADSVVKITFAEDMGNAGIMSDGQIEEPLRKDSQVVIQQGAYPVVFITFRDTNYFRTLRTKMGWGQRGNTVM
jgi:NAD+ kinase